MAKNRGEIYAKYFKRYQRKGMTLICPLCKCEQYQVIYRHLNSNIAAQVVQCNRCDHYYTLLKTVVETTTLYNDEIYKVVENRNSIFDKILTFEYNRVVSEINGAKSKNEWLLDF